MLTNNEIKKIKSLREKKFRDSLGLFVVEGEKMVQEALSSGFEIVKIVRCEDEGDAVMARISSLSTPSPILAVVKKPSIDAVEKPEGLCLALDSIRDPGNLGTIMRIADWFAVERIYASPDTVEVYNPKVIQASMGTIFRKILNYCNLPELCKSFASSGMQVFGTFLEGENIYECELPKEGLIIMGNESDGISPEVSAEVSRRLTIPSFAKGAGAESLNVASAAAVILSEFRRR
jgi:TrmH family RNA methyltransferase